MPEFCDVALPVPLDTVFTYSVPDGMQPVVGGRVLVPFRQQRMSGVVTDLHDRKPKVATKSLINVLDPAPVLDDQLIRLGRWIANYYLAPVGEVFRTMLPLGAEFKRSVGYRITEEGRLRLHLAGMSGSSARSQKTPEDQFAEFRVLDYLAEREMTREDSLRSATRASRPLLAGMVRKKWITPQDLSEAGRAARTTKVAVLKDREGSLNANQQTLLDTLAAAGGKAPVGALRSLGVPGSTLSTLVKRGMVELIEEAAAFTVSGLKARPRLFDFQFNPAQEVALYSVQQRVNARTFAGMLLHGITGSGKTAIYLAAMRSVLEAGRSAILLVPEIGLTPAVAADLHQLFGDEVAILHSALSDKERAEQWHRIRRGDARMVVGTRSAVFAPVSDLALVIVDEEQDPSYKQEEMPRYHARDVAVMRAKMANAVVVLGSATPSLESYFNAKKTKYALLELPDRVEKRPLPEVEIIDMRQEFQETGQRAGDLTQAGGRNQGAPGTQRAGDGAAEPPRIFPGGAVPRLRQNAGVQELRHRDDPSQALPPHGMPLLRLHRAGAERLRSLWQRVCIFSRHRLGKIGRAAARHVSPGPYRASGPRYRARPRGFRARAKRAR